MVVNNQSNPFEFSEADTCREFVTPAIQTAGWGNSPFEIAEQRSFTDGRIVLTGRTAKRREGILDKERQIIAIMEQVQALLKEPL